MSLYLESSAVVSWLLGEPPGDEVARLLNESDEIFSSDLTLLECDRAIRRAVAVGRLGPGAAGRAAERLARESAPWVFHGLDAEILRRASRDFPHEPVRALDALHLTTAVVFREIRPGLRLVSFDHRVRENATALGFEAVPRSSR